MFPSNKVNEFNKLKMISLCMIVKNEEKVLDRCLNSLKDTLDEIIIIDTGSHDGTKEIALKYTDKVFDFTWCNDFSKARNFSISKASNDWVLILDADEVIKEFNIGSLKSFCNENNNKVTGRIKIVNEYEDDYGTKRYIERINRLFNRKFFEYKGSIHEQIVCKNGLDYMTQNVDIVVDHTGYSKEVLNRTNKIQRNIDLLRVAIKENNKDPYLYYQLGKSYFMGKNYKEASIFFEKAVTLVDNFGYEYVEDLIESYGYSLINLNEFKKAKIIEKYNKYYLSSPDYYFLMALVYMNNNEFQKAAETFLRCTEFKEGKVEGITTYLPLYNIGIIFECLGLKEEALSYYNKCGDYNPAKKRASVLLED
ncbi:glycosyltransferase family 2 protein [Clostridium amazonitimonense]|uniref:glycosyltransferase family 2 protein n=1 Tax=Clostridium amazonitimonense TaxID=1499689 RepID=UPI000B32A66D|nr:glycosyltransferase family 2 protein [Clostridium amazonitimonense]